MNEKVFAIWLSEAIGPGSAYGKVLVEKYGSFEEIYKLSESGYKEAGIRAGSAVYARLCNKNIAFAQKVHDFCAYNRFEIIEGMSVAYPGRLWSINNPPMVLYARGRMISFDDNPCVAVVGTRSYSEAGWRSTYKITSGIASAGVIVITGLASGIDTAATRAALDSAGFAVGVLGTGVEKVYPSENRELFEEMYTKGLVVSERPPFSEITGKYFPIRNRIISGLADGVLVGEGANGSGSLITAAHASEQGRRVFAIPGDISNPESSGVNKLIRDGAVPVFDASDVIFEYKYIYSDKINSGIDNSADIAVPEGRSKKRIRVLRGRFDNNPEPTIRVKAVPDVSQKKDKPVKKSGNVRTSALDFDGTFKIAKDEASAKAEFDVSILGELERKVYDHICKSEFKMNDSIHLEINEDPIAVSIAITTLEIAGFIETEGPKIFKAKK